MSVQAYYGLRKGGSGGRTVSTAAEAEKILRGGYGVTNVVMRDQDDEIVGERVWRDIDGRMQWWWYYDRDAFL